MSELSERLIEAAEASAVPVYEKTECAGVGCCGDFYGAIRAAVVATLRELVENAFPPGEDVDYEYACEGMVGDAVDVLRELDDR